MQMRQYAYLGSLLTVLILSSACSQREKLTEGDIAPVSVQLGFRFGEHSSNQAVKGVVTDITNPNHTNWGIGSIRLLAFSNHGAVEKGETALNMPLSLPDLRKNDLVGPNYAHLYSSADIAVPLHTASVLVYGKALPLSDTYDKHVDGSLLESGFGRETSSISFSPDVIYDGAYTGAPSVILSILNAVGFGDPYSTDAYYKSNDILVKAPDQLKIYWNDSVGDEELLLFYRYFINDGELMAGAGDRVESRLNSVYAQLRDYESDNNGQCSVSVNGVSYPAYNEDETPLQYKQLYNGLCTVLKERFEALYDANGYMTYDEDEGVLSFKSSELRDYPESLGLPSGAAVVRWTSTGFLIPASGGVSGIPSLDAFCYPPALYYYVNSTIHTSDKDMSEYYNSQNQWGFILGKYDLDTYVSKNATAMAVDDPLQYAVGKLYATIKAAAEELEDSEGNLVPVGDGSTFPVTGIIIGGQYPQFYDFTADDSSAEELFLYDKSIVDVSLRAKVDSNPIHTLVLPTPKEEPVYFCVELLNNGDLFYGAEGRIYPGQKFYLTGKLDFKQSQKEQFPSVFMRDYETKISCVIPSLKWAHSAVPDLSLPLLSLGIEAHVNWKESTPSTVVLD